MKIQELLALVDGKVVTSSDYNSYDIEYGLASDLMSDVLTFDVENSILITGLANLQTIRTLEMSDIECVIIARNKKVTPEMIELANEKQITIIDSPYTIFRISGILYENGIKPLY
ncbi:MAG: hypothetical protein JEZ09_00815 [Salinivirgaceae bacterium]|nr:hypothetical protein [Salinivirgaceae bacterium]